MNLEEQKKILDLIITYENTSSEIIKYNLKRYIKMSKYSAQEIATAIKISIHTIYSITKKQFTDYKKDFIVAVKICNFLEIPITSLFNNINTYNDTKYFGKYTEEVKHQFLIDYVNLTGYDFFIKYDLAKRTADEYYRRFKKEIEEKQITK
jgi:DNA-binding XRE family transcriptional regulator